MKITSQTPYSLKSVILSHGWSDLNPFVKLSDDSMEVSLRGKKEPRVFCVTSIKNGFVVNGNPSSEEIQTLKHMFRLSDDMGEFYKLAKNENRDWIVKKYMGRMLRSQSLFEDLIKMILTTNCSWSFTKIMVRNMCKHLGERAPNEQYLFPTPEKMASKNETFYRDKIRAGYRSPHFPVIAKKVLKKEIDLEKWSTSDLSSEELRKKILTIPGAGPYVADNMLKLMGRFDYLGLDSWVRKTLKDQWKSKKPPEDKQIVKKYAKYGKYKGLILWCDVTKDWF